MTIRRMGQTDGEMALIMAASTDIAYARFIVNAKTSFDACVTSWWQCGNAQFSSRVSAKKDQLDELWEVKSLGWSGEDPHGGGSWEGILAKLWDKGEHGETMESLRLVSVRYLGPEPSGEAIGCDDEAFWAKALLAAKEKNVLSEQLKDLELSYDSRRDAL